MNKNANMEDFENKNNTNMQQDSTLTDKYIDIFTDFGFKKIFGQECNKELLLNFLNELLHKDEGKIVSLTYLKNEQLGCSEDSRKAIYDLYCENENGEKFIVELQNRKQTYFKDRSIYYSTFAITDQALVGKSWNYRLKNVYIICILNFVMADNKNNNNFQSEIKLTNIDTGEIFYDKLKYIYLEMPKFTKKINELETRYDKWIYVLKNLDRLDNIPEELRDRVFEKMFAAAEVAKLSQEEYKSYIKDLNSYRDYNNTLDYAREEGVEKGVELGRKEGRKEERLEIAKNAKVMGLSVSQIQKLTNLSIKEIESL